MVPRGVGPDLLAFFSGVWNVASVARSPFLTARRPRRRFEDWFPAWRGGFRGTKGVPKGV